MSQPRPCINTNVAACFLARCFAPGETIALLLRRENPATTQQRIATVERILEPHYLRWLAYENNHGANIYFAANPLLSGSRKRTKDSVAEVRHLYLDIDTDGNARLNALRTSNVVPAPHAILSTSPEKYQVLWSVLGFSFVQQECALKQLAITFGGDPACTDRNRVLRLPGFLNCKYDPAVLVEVEYAGSSVFAPNDFRLAKSIPNDIINSLYIRREIPVRSHTKSENDWIWVLKHIAQGTSSAKLTEMLALRRTDKPNPRYYAQRTVDVASAWLWLMERIPASQVVLRLKARRRLEIDEPLCSTRADEIAEIAQYMINRKNIA